VSGSLKAVNSVVVKARVPGELQGLTVREGDVVKAGQVIARIDATEGQARVRQAREQAESAKAQIDMVQRQYDNNKALVDQGFISKTALDTSLNNLNAAQATHKAAIAAVDRGCRQIGGRHVLKAPISGVVAQRLAQPGERVAIDTKIVEIVDLSGWSWKPPERHRLGGCTRGPGPRSCRLKAAASPSRRAWCASIPGAGRQPQRAGLPRQPGCRRRRRAALAPGAVRAGHVGTASASAAVAVPVSAVRTDKPAPYVQAVENDKVVHKSVNSAHARTAGKDSVGRGQGPGRWRGGDSRRRSVRCAKAPR
jgi:multidrug efflux system membrane fusion protein